MEFRTFAGNSSNLFRSYWLRATLIFCIISVPVFIVSLKFKEYAYEQTRERFAADASIASVIVSNALLFHLEDFIALSRHATFVPNESREDFGVYVTNYLGFRKGIQAYEWIPAIHNGARARFERDVSQEWGLQFFIRQKNSVGNLIPAESRELYYPVCYVEPYKGNEAALGFDLGSSPARLAALEAARDSGKPTATERIKLVQESGTQFGFLLFIPVFEKGKIPSSVQERRDRLRGFSLGVFRVGDMLQAALGSLREKNLTVRLVDLSASKGNEVLHDGVLQGVDMREQNNAIPLPNLILEAKHDLPFAGRTWQIQIRPLHGYIHTDLTWPNKVILPVGLLISILMSLFITAQIKNRDNAVNLASERSSALLDMDRVLTAISAVLIGVDSGGNVTKWNHAATTVLRLSEEETIGKALAGLNIRWDWDAVLSGLNRCSLEVRPTKVSPLSYKHSNNSDGLMILTMSPLLDETGCIEGILLQGEDVTEVKLLEAQLAQAQRLESIGQLAAGIAHEINTPAQFVRDSVVFLQEACEDLMKVIDFCVADHPAASQPKEIRKTLEDADYEFIKEELPRAFERVKDGLERISTIVQAMRRFSHPGGGEKTAVDINKALENTLIVTRNTWKYVAEVETKYSETLPMVSGLPSELNQVFLNIIVNAADAVEEANKATGQKGLIRVVTRLEGAFAEIAISDTGGGIPEDIRAHIFDPFFTTKPVGKGTGQGLAISYDIITNKHGGTISLETEPGKGTTFILRLPLTDSRTCTTGDGNQ